MSGMTRIGNQAADYLMNTLRPRPRVNDPATLSRNIANMARASALNRQGEIEALRPMLNKAVANPDVGAVYALPPTPGDTAPIQLMTMPTDGAALKRLLDAKSQYGGMAGQAAMPGLPANFQNTAALPMPQAAIEERMGSLGMPGAVNYGLKSMPELAADEVRKRAMQNELAQWTRLIGAGGVAGGAASQTGGE